MMFEKGSNYYHPHKWSIYFIRFNDMYRASKGKKTIKTSNTFQINLRPVQRSSSNLVMTSHCNVRSIPVIYIKEKNKQQNSLTWYFLPKSNEMIQMDHWNRYRRYSLLLAYDVPALFCGPALFLYLKTTVWLEVAFL